MGRLPIRRDLSAGEYLGAAIGGLRQVGLDHLADKLDALIEADAALDPDADRSALIREAATETVAKINAAGAGDA